MTNPLSSGDALIPHPASTSEPIASVMREHADTIRDVLGPIFRAQSAVSPMGDADFKDFKTLSKLIQVYPSLADLSSSSLSTYLTEPGLRHALPYLFAEKNVRMAAVAMLLFAVVMAKLGPESFWANAIPAVAIVVISTFMIEKFALGPLNESGVTEDSILFYANISQKVSAFSELIRNNPTAVKAVVTLGLTLTLASHLISKGYTPDPSFATTLLQTVQTAAPQVFNTNLVHTILFTLFSAGISPDALSNLLKDVAKASSGATHAYRAISLCEMLAEDPVKTLREGHEKMRPLQLEALYEALDEEFKAIEGAIRSLQTQRSTTQDQLISCQEELAAAQKKLAETTTSTLDSYRGYTERVADTTQALPSSKLSAFGSYIAGAVYSNVTQQELQNRKDAKMALQQENVQKLLQKQHRLSATLARVDDELKRAQASRQTFLDTHPTTAKQLAIYEENVRSSKAFKKKMNLATVASCGWTLAKRYRPKSLASREPTVFDEVASNIQTLVTKSLIKIPAGILARLIVTQGLPFVLNSSLQQMGYDSSSPYVQIPSQMIGWGLFAVLLNQYVNTYSTTAIEEEKRKPLEESQLVTALTKRLPAHKQAQVQGGITDVISALDAKECPLLTRLQTASRGISSIAASSDRIPNELLEGLRYQDAAWILLQGLARDPTTTAAAGAAGAASGGAGIDDDDRIVLTDPAHSSKRSGMQEIFTAVQGAYASTDPDTLARERKSKRPQLML